MLDLSWTLAPPLIAPILPWYSPIRSALQFWPQGTPKLLLGNGNLECFTKNFLFSSHTQKIWLYLIRIIRTYFIQNSFTVTSLFCNVNIHADLCTIVSNSPHAKQPYANRRCSNYIFILDWTSDFNRLRKDTYKTKQETFQFWNLLRRLY